MPAFLVLGCANFYGRALVEQLCAARGAGDGWVIRGVDKVLPALASFPPATLELFETFEYRMGNLRSAAFLEQAFAADQPWDAVFNFAAEHKFGQADGVYAQDVHQLSVAVAELAARHRVGALVQLSTALVYARATGGRCTEDDATADANALVASHLRAERDVRAVAGLPPLAVLRPALCYGPGDRQNVVPMMISALLSRVAGEPMPVLWDKALRASTVHVADVARAAIAAAAHCRRTQTTAVYNLADPGDTTNGDLARAVADLFGVKPDFQSAAVNFIAKRLRVEELAEEVNESLLGPWMDLLAQHNIANSPLSPYLDREHPYCRLEHCPLAVDGSRIAATPGLDFQYRYPAVGPDALRPIVEEFQRVGLWPSIPL
ncbi:hypothetical protein H4R21_005547 [Coemansia helicoidea]|uniref:Uncharacterized protein n=1 Tax=Coemansia helicoidea TaxID=1286919 RepID=A0ACC1KST7_9FUNG|nr:hypothetical protein H4R21_005547 [Coemansia helicoidea]